MSSEGDSLVLGDVVSLVRGTTYKSALLGRPGPVLLGLASIQRNGGFRSDSLKTYGGESKSKLLLKPGDLFVSLKDVTQSADLLGAIARVPPSVSCGRLTQDTVRLDFKQGSYPGILVYWVLRTPQFRSYCREHATGTTNLGLSRDDFLAFALPPSNDSALSLVEMLDALDDRIDNLRATNATLESIAQAIFKSWFIDFDPVRAKMEGREPEGMDAETAALFPSEFEESELGLIPKGWRVKSLDEVADYLNGLAMQKFPPESASEYLPVIKIAQLRAGHTEGADKASAMLSGNYIVEDGDILFSWSGSLEVVIWFGGRGALNQHLFKVTSTKVPKWFYYFATKQHLSEFREIAANKATTMGHIQRRHLAEAKITAPPSNVLDALSARMSPLIDLLSNNKRQAKQLAQIRDTLLPRLVSGRFSVKLGTSDATEQAT